MSVWRDVVGPDWRVARKVESGLDLVIPLRPKE